MLSKLKRTLNPIKSLLILTRNYYYDLKRYYSYTYSGNNKLKQKNLEANIIKHYHVLEKGLSMPKIKPGFGQSVALSLINLCQDYIKLGYSLENNQFLSAVGVLEKYIDFNSQYCNLNEMKDSLEQICSNLKSNKKPIEGGYKKLSSNELRRVIDKGFKEFAMNRYSIRDYSQKEVDVNLIKEAIMIAQKSPSVCNRQGSKAYVITDKERISKTLSFQNGNRGFGHLANKLIIVTTDLRVFEGVHERNQSYIDGGLFAMSLLYGLHYFNLGACSLNWCNDYRVDQEFKKFIGINDYENIVMMISVGHLQDNFRVGVSQRRDLDEVLTFV